MFFTKIIRDADSKSHHSLIVDLDREVEDNFTSRIVTFIGNSLTVIIIDIEKTQINGFLFHAKDKEEYVLLGS